MVVFLMPFCYSIKHNLFYCLSNKRSFFMNPFISPNPSAAIVVSLLDQSKTMQEAVSILTHSFPQLNNHAAENATMEFLKFKQQQLSESDFDQSLKALGITEAEFNSWKR